MTWRQGEWGRVLAIMALALIVGGAGVFVLSRVLDRTVENRASQIHTARQARVVVRLGCERQNVALGVLRAIILRGEGTLKEYLREGTLTRVQYERALASSRRARRELAGADCMALARRIPVPRPLT